jgi:SAM-dependent methyltransferase
MRLIGRLRENADWFPHHSLTDAFSKLTKLDGNETVVEIGSGEGVMSFWIASNISEGGKLVSFDIDLNATHRCQTRAANIGIKNAIFEYGDAYDVPLPDDYAQVVFCKNLLCVLKKPESVLREMKRVTKKDGILLTIEPCSAQIIFDPSDGKFARLGERWNLAFTEGWRTLGVDQHIGIRVPQMMRSLGINNITVEASVQANLLCDSRRTRGDILQQLNTEALELPSSTVSLLKAGGLSQSELDDFHKLAVERSFNYSVGDKFMESAYVRIMPVYLLTMGRK